jgi:hypothetical protein
MTDTYEIIGRVPKRPKPIALDLPKIRASMERLEVGAAFVIPAGDLRDRKGEYRTKLVGYRLHRLAALVGIRITTSKMKEGLRVRREK